MVYQADAGGEPSVRLMANKALKWYAKRLIRRYSPDLVSQWLLGRETPAYHLWSIGIVSGSSPTHLQHTGAIKNPVLTREHVTVALTGDAGDELFCGYERYRAVRMTGQMDFVPRWMHGNLHPDKYSSPQVKAVQTRVLQHLR